MLSLLRGGATFALRVTAPREAHTSADLARNGRSADWAVVRPYRNIMDGSSQPYRVVMPPVAPLRAASCAGSDVRCAPTLAVRGSVGLDRGSAFRAEKWAALGEVPLDGVYDEGESPPWDFPGGLDCSVGGASSGLGLDFGGHDLHPVIALGGPPG